MPVESDGEMEVIDHPNIFNEHQVRHPALGTHICVCVCACVLCMYLHIYVFTYHVLCIYVCMYVYMSVYEF